MLSSKCIFSITENYQSSSCTFIYFSCSIISHCRRLQGVVKTTPEGGDGRHIVLFLLLPLYGSLGLLGCLIIVLVFGILYLYLFSRHTWGSQGKALELGIGLSLGVGLWLRLWSWPRSWPRSGLRSRLRFWPVLLSGIFICTRSRIYLASRQDCRLCFFTKVVFSTDLVRNWACCFTICMMRSLLEKFQSSNQWFHQSVRGQKDQIPLKSTAWGSVPTVLPFHLEKLSWEKDFSLSLNTYRRWALT